MGSVFCRIVYEDINTSVDGVSELLDALRSISFYFSFRSTVLWGCLNHYVDIMEIESVHVYE